MHWAKTGYTHCHAPLGLSDKGPAIKGLVIYHSRDLERLDMLNGLALACYEPPYDILFLSNVLYLYPCAIRQGLKYLKFYEPWYYT